MPKYRINYSKDCYEAAKARRIAWREGRKSDRIPTLFHINGAPSSYNTRECIEDADKAVEATVLSIAYQLEHFPEGDALPMFNLAYLGEGLIPSMFGAEQYIVDHCPPFTKGRVIMDLERDLPRLQRRIDPERDGWGPRAREATEKFIDATGGAFPVSNVDIQSPYGVATKIVDNEALMLAMYDAPELVHEILSITTQAIIDTTYAMQKWAGDALAMNVVDPLPGGGITIYDDYISVITPRLSMEFCHPYNMRIFEEFGNGHLHTCGPYFEGFIDAVLKHSPVSVDMSCMRDPLTKTRADMRRFKRICDEHGVLINGSLGTYPTGQYDQTNQIPYDEAFLAEMGGDGRLLWSEYGPLEEGRKCLEMAKRCLSR